MIKTLYVHKPGVTVISVDLVNFSPGQECLIISAWETFSSRPLGIHLHSGFRNGRKTVVTTLRILDGGEADSGNLFTLTHSPATGGTSIIFILLHSSALDPFRSYQRLGFLKKHIKSSKWGHTHLWSSLLYLNWNFSLCPKSHFCLEKCKDGRIYLILT